jgi:hypothetical protein
MGEGAAGAPAAGVAAGTVGETAAGGASSTVDDAGERAAKIDAAEAARMETRKGEAPVRGIGAVSPRGLIESQPVGRPAVRGAGMLADRRASRPLADCRASRPPGAGRTASSARLV